MSGEAILNDTQVYEITDTESQQLATRFTYHPPAPGQAKRYEELRRIFRAVAASLLAACPRSRELSIAMTELETANLWANAAIARNEAAANEPSHEEAACPEAVKP